MPEGRKVDTWPPFLFQSPWISLANPSIENWPPEKDEPHFINDISAMDNNKWIRQF